ncbi:hypothetical protein [Microvirga mediterraneensis]|uniref:Uncharacterized protein n=1 Tax=Microvirga mediterraneensis TaxID=2754695 RepID=A0A838BNE1_9HYPH|nr:hypothetical protein [Microvirga mediterraneensis]MBA1156920.1 hypothetical protein [Microvirga mediterraneensis]
MADTPIVVRWVEPIALTADEIEALANGISGRSVWISVEDLKGMFPSPEPEDNARSR